MELCQYKTITCLTFIITIFITGNVECKLPWGSPCTKDAQCQSSFMTRDGSFNKDVELFKMDTISECKNSRCDCGLVLHHIKVFKNNNYMCVSSGWIGLFSHGGEAPKCNLNDTETCVNGICKENWMGDNFPNMCTCNEGFIYDGVNCREFVNVDYNENCQTPESGPVPMCNYTSLMMCNSTSLKCGCYKNLFYDGDKACSSKEEYIKKFPERFIVGLDEFCGTSKDGWPKTCNKTENISCQSNKCKCTWKYYPIESNKTCESKETYVKAHNLTEYKVMPGVYCYDGNDCITGLDCYKNKCSCPYPCKFENKTSSCDCGKVSALEGASPAILVGIIGGLVIIAFWARLINKIIKRESVKSKWGGTPVHTEPETSIPVTSIPATSIPATEPYRIRTCTTNPEPVTVPLVKPVSVPSDSKAPPPPDYSTPPPDYSTPPPDYSTPTAAYTPYQAAGYSSDHTPAQNPGAVPPAYPYNGPSAPPSTYPSSAPSAPLGFSSTTQSGTSDDPPAYTDIYKPVIL